MWLCAYLELRFNLRLISMTHYGSWRMFEVLCGIHMGVLFLARHDGLAIQLILQGHV
jgi:hypothetical protein